MAVAAATTASKDGKRPTRSIYVHVPFCRHRCGYCNFALEANRDYLIDRFLNALQFELDSRRLPSTVDTLYLGGGTPTRLPPEKLRELNRILRDRFELAAAAEFTMEANPADLGQATVAAMRELGVNRVSLGAQSFQTDKLRLLERDHTAQSIEDAVDACRPWAQAISLDLIFGTPGESLTAWLDDLRLATQLPVDHLSTYELTFEKGTRFWNRLLHGEWQAADQDLRADMYEATIDTMRQRGWEHYEISSFSLPARACRHNLTYWTGEAYLGFGPGAASFVGGTRQNNHASLSAYLRALEGGKSPCALAETLTPLAAARERLAIGLRRLQGIDIDQVQSDSGCDVDRIAGRALTELIALGLLERNARSMRLTRRGVFLYDSVASCILTDDCGSMR